jgi:hypothetical protein
MVNPLLWYCQKASLFDSAEVPTVTVVKRSKLFEAREQTWWQLHSIQLAGNHTDRLFSLIFSKYLCYPSKES